MLSMVKWLTPVAGVLFAGVALHEWLYANDHPYAYGPAKVIAVAALAGAVLSVGVFFLFTLVELAEKRLVRLDERVVTLENGGDE